MDIGTEIERLQNLCETFEAHLADSHLKNQGLEERLLKCGEELDELKFSQALLEQDLDLHKETIKELNKTIRSQNNLIEAYGNQSESSQRLLGDKDRVISALLDTAHREEEGNGKKRKLDEIWTV